jgi:hypothetical protein
MSGLTFLAVWVQRLLGWLPDPVVAVVWLPLFFVVLVGGLRVFLRVGLPWVVEVGQRLAALIVAMLAVPVMAALLVIAVPFRWRRRNPPGLVLGVDDMVVSAATTGMGAVKRVAVAAGPVSRAHFLIVLALGIVLLWRWNAGYCPQGDVACTPPVAVWADVVGIDDLDRQPVAPVPSETPTDPPVPPSDS